MLISGMSWFINRHHCKTCSLRQSFKASGVCYIWIPVPVQQCWSHPSDFKWWPWSSEVSRGRVPHGHHLSRHWLLPCSFTWRLSDVPGKHKLFQGDALPGPQHLALSLVDAGWPSWVLLQMIRLWSQWWILSVFFHKVIQSKRNTFNTATKVRKPYSLCPSHWGLSSEQNMVGLTPKFTSLLLEFAVAKHPHQHRNSRGTLLQFSFIPIRCF